MFGSLLVPALALAHGHNSHDHWNSGDRSSRGSGSTGSTSGSGGSTGGGSSTPPPVTPPPVVPPVAGEIRYTAYTTGYAAKDNTPAGSTQVDLGGHSGNAGGTGTFSDPITLAVGHSITGGKDTGDYPYGTKWYVPNLRKYFMAADSCGDGNTPQNGPCHTGYQGHVWLDLYVGASLANGVLTCEDNITNLHLVIQNPASNYAVVAGAVYDSGCQQYGDTVVTQ